MSLPKVLENLLLDDLFSDSIGNSDVNFSDALQLLSIIEEHGDTILHRSLQTVLTRLIETNLLKHPDYLILIKRWPAIAGSSKSIISQKIKEQIGFTPPESLVRHVEKIISGNALSHGRKRSISIYDYTKMLEEIFDRNASDKLRCNICGYHFCHGDLGEERLDIAQSIGFKFASSINPKRQTDIWKPPTRRKKSYTGLEVDHKVPQEGLGWSGSDNYQVCCSYCNSGMMAFRWALEPLSVFAAAGVSNYPNNRLSILVQSIVVSAFKAHRGECVKCGKNKNSVEISAKPRVSHEKIKMTGLAPWNIDVICYNCF